MEVSGVFQKLFAMLLVPHIDGIAFEDVHQIGERSCGTTRHAWRQNRRWSEKRTLRQSWKRFCGSREEDREAKSEVVRRIAWVIEKITWDLELFITYPNVYRGCEQLRCESRYYQRSINCRHDSRERMRTAEKLRIRKELHEMWAIPRLNMVALQM